jgi:hypothetical protein
MREYEIIGGLRVASGAGLEQRIAAGFAIRAEVP